MKRTLSIIATIGTIIFFIGLACVESNITATIIISGIGAAMTAISLYRMDGELDVH